MLKLAAMADEATRKEVGLPDYVHYFAQALVGDELPVPKTGPGPCRHSGVDEALAAAVAREVFFEPLASMVGWAVLWGWVMCMCVIRGNAECSWVLPRASAAAGLPHALPAMLPRAHHTATVPTPSAEAQLRPGRGGQG